MTTFDPYASSRETTEGTVYSVTGGDWDQLTAEIGSLKEEKIVVNMGPQHPSTHGVLRLVLELEGETVSEVRCGIGYLHTGIEKNTEYRTWTQATTFVTRMDYLSPLFNETSYCFGNSCADDGAKSHLLTHGCAGHRCFGIRCNVPDVLRLP
jgi:NADH-quinone oxidoreductase subunit D